MQTIKLIRYKKSERGVQGNIVMDGVTKMMTLELPDRDNQAGISCIPPGSYLCQMAFSNHIGADVYHLQGVPCRTSVLIHCGNTIADTEGCILVGRAYTKTVSLPLFLLESHAALASLYAITNKEPFTLAVEEHYDAE